MRFPAQHILESPEALALRAAAARPRLVELLEAENIAPAAYLDALESTFVPLAGWLARRRSPGRPAIVGLSGAQGTGKSTLAAVLQHVLEDGYGLRCARLSLDDLYLTRAERAELARSVHPLLRTRGVPGTHDVELGQQLMAALATTEVGRVEVPRFDKAADDRAPAARWIEVETPLDCVLFEGWCVGARAASARELEEPLNALEGAHDHDGRYRRYVNERLGSSYRALFDRLDRLVFLAAPDLAASRSWRTEQEHKLRARVSPGVPTMTDEEVAHFVQYYERISQHMLAELPGRADVVLQLDRDHQFCGVRVRG